MKFDRLMLIYWSKGLYYNKKLVTFNLNLKNFFYNIQGISHFTKFNFFKKFEINYKLATFFFLNWRVNKNKILNTYLSSIIYTSTNIQELKRYNLIRLYLIKSFRGRAQALGKPSRGQRTWSNAWTAFKYNTDLRNFIIQVNKSRSVKKKPVKINYKRLSIKLKKPTIKIKKNIKKRKINLWY